MYVITSYIYILPQSALAAAPCTLRAVDMYTYQCTFTRSVLPCSRTTVRVLSRVTHARPDPACRTGLRGRVFNSPHPPSHFHHHAHSSCATRRVEGWGPWFSPLRDWAELSLGLPELIDEVSSMTSALVEPSSPVSRVGRQPPALSRPTHSLREGRRSCVCVRSYGR